MGTQLSEEYGGSYPKNYPQVRILYLYSACGNTYLVVPLP
jgi:hypothetical protein